MPALAICGVRRSSPPWCPSRTTLSCGRTPCPPALAADVQFTRRPPALPALPALPAPSRLCDRRCGTCPLRLIAGGRPRCPTDRRAQAIGQPSACRSVRPDYSAATLRRGGRVVEGARLEIVYTLIAYRGFESLPLRHIYNKAFDMNCFIAFLSLILSFASFATAKSIENTQCLPPITRMVVEKEQRQLSVYGKSGLIKTYKVALGFSPEGHKEKQGDGKTPEGCYTICAKNPNSQFHKSLRVSYPSVKDKKTAQEKGIQDPGGDIMVHGLGKGFSHLGKLHCLQDWTLGCIALTNEEIEEIYDAVSVKTVIEIKT